MICFPSKLIQNFVHFLRSTIERGRNLCEPKIVRYKKIVSNYSHILK
jgi:predicted DNA-binding protein (UPF0278 family)